MSWKITLHKSTNGMLELQVMAEVRDMAEVTFATYAESLETQFKNGLKRIRGVNGYTAENMFKMKTITHYTIEIWKMTVIGEYKKKMCTLDFIK
jgi:hypothetical protein